jgi:hypothetical protein
VRRRTVCGTTGAGPSSRCEARDMDDGDTPGCGRRKEAWLPSFHPGPLVLAHKLIH